MSRQCLYAEKFWLECKNLNRNHKTAKATEQRGDERPPRLIAVTHSCHTLLCMTRKLETASHLLKNIFSVLIYENAYMTPEASLAIQKLYRRRTGYYSTGNITRCSNKTPNKLSSSYFADFESMNVLAFATRALVIKRVLRAVFLCAIRSLVEIRHHTWSPRHILVLESCDATIGRHKSILLGSRGTFRFPPSTFARVFGLFGWPPHVSRIENV